ncbi:MAG: CpsD/CapB family tyrosine-protein kinase [Pseudomonadota bacterium]
MTIETLRDAVEKSRVERGAASTALALSGPAQWSSLQALQPTPTARRRSVFDAPPPVREAFDMLRTRLLKITNDNAWTKIGVTAPRKGAGATYTALNLAMALSRAPDVRVMLVDLDLDDPGLAEALQVRGLRPLKDFLSGEVPAEDHFLRIGDSLIIGANTARPGRGKGGGTDGGADILHGRRARLALDETIARYRPTVVIYDLPPVRRGDAALGALSLVDGALLVAEAGATRTREIAECEQLILEHAHLIGVLLNKAEAIA